MQTQVVKYWSRSKLYSRVKTYKVRTCRCIYRGLARIIKGVDTLCQSEGTHQAVKRGLQKEGHTAGVTILALLATPLLCYLNYRFFYFAFLTLETGFLNQLSRKIKSGKFSRTRSSHYFSRFQYYRIYFREIFLASSSH